MKWSRNEPFIISLRESGAGSIIAALSASGSEASFIKIISGGNPLPLGGGRSLVNCYPICYKPITFRSWVVDITPLIRYRLIVCVFDMVNIHCY